MKLPLWLDMIGTMAAAIQLGPLAGTLTGVISALFSIPLNAISQQGSVGNVWGDALKDIMGEDMHDPHVIAVIANSGDLWSNACSLSHIPRGLNSTVIKISPEYVGSCNEDVIYHEYTHSVIGCKDKLNAYANENGALNEAYADIMGDVIANDHTWTHGDRDAKSERSRYDSEWINTSTEPTDDDHNGVHTNCEVIYHCAYLMYQRFISEFGISEDAAMQEIGNLWFDSMSYLPQDNASFEDCLEALCRAGEDRKYDTERLQMIENCFYKINVKRTNYSSIQDAVRTYSGTYAQA